MRPRTRVTLTSLTGVLLESILKERALSSYDEGGESLGGLEEEADVKMILPCVGSKLREGSGLLTPEPSGIFADSGDLHRHLILQAVNHVPFSLSVQPCGPAHYYRISTIVRVKSQKITQFIVNCHLFYIHVGHSSNTNCRVHRATLVRWSPPTSGRSQVHRSLPLQFLPQRALCPTSTLRSFNCLEIPC